MREGAWDKRVWVEGSLNEATKMRHCGMGGGE